MKTQEIITSNLSEFGWCEIKQASRLLNAWVADGLPEDFDTQGVHIAMNRNSGFVFLVNEEYQVAMMNGDKLETWYHCCNCGNEGFKEDCEISEDGEHCCSCICD